MYMWMTDWAVTEVSNVLLSELTSPRPLSLPEADPEFSGPINNVTVALGREAILVCPVTELWQYKVKVKL